MKQKYIPTLDGWRGVAISVVVIGHAFHQTWAVMGVEIFFAISGYLICTNMLVERETTGHISLANFYRRRAFRILPAALTYLAILSVLVALGVTSATYTDILSCIFLWANYNFSRGWEVRHFWSLSMEEHFYLMWPAVLTFLGNRRARIFAAVATLAVCAWRVGANLSDDGILARTDMRLDVFLVPCMAAILLREERWKAVARKLSLPLCLSLLAGLALLKYLKLSGTALSLELLFQSCVFTAFVIYTVTHSKELLGKLLEQPALRWVGRISYSIYIWQQICVRPSIISSHIPFVPVRIALAVVLASLSYYLIERPMIRMGRKLEALPVPAMETAQ